jgi:hypothetical protein
MTTTTTTMTLSEALAVEHVDNKVIAALVASGAEVLPEHVDSAIEKHPLVLLALLPRVPVAEMYALATCIARGNTYMGAALVNNRSFDLLARDADGKFLALSRCATPLTMEAVNTFVSLLKGSESPAVRQLAAATITGASPSDTLRHLCLMMTFPPIFMAPTPVPDPLGFLCDEPPSHPSSVAQLCDAIIDCMENVRSCDKVRDLISCIKSQRDGCDLHSWLQKRGSAIDPALVSLAPEDLVAVAQFTVGSYVQRTVSRSWHVTPTTLEGSSLIDLAIAVLFATFPSAFPSSNPEQDRMRALAALSLIGCLPQEPVSAAAADDDEQEPASAASDQ